MHIIINDIERRILVFPTFNGASIQDWQNDRTQTITLYGDELLDVIRALQIEQNLIEAEEFEVLEWKEREIP